MSIIDVYGLQSCDNTKKALKEFKAKNVMVEFHDLKVSGLKKEKLAYWCKQLGWEKVLNRKSTTWRSLAPEVQQAVIDERSAIELMLKYTSLIKRPVVEMNERVTVGLSESILPNKK